MVSSGLNHPATLLTSVTELDGVRIGLRLARRSDAAAVREFLEHLSRESRMRRFGAATPRVASSLVRHFTAPDGHSRIVVLATAPIDGTERVVGIADVAFLRADAAEIAFVVAEELHGRGLGRLLAETAAGLAARRGVRRLRAEIPLGGPAALAIMQSLGPTVASVEDGASVAVTVLPVPDEWLASPAHERRAS